MMMRSELRKLVNIAVILFCLPWAVLAQETPQPIRMEKKFGGFLFTQNGKQLKPKDVLAEMKTKPEAHQVFKKAKSNLDVASVFGFTGGFLIGWPLGAALAGGEPQWGMAAAGGGLLLLSIPFSSSFKKHATKAVDIYNGGQPTAAGRPVKLQWGFYGTAAKVSVSW